MVPRKNKKCFAQEAQKLVINEETPMLKMGQMYWGMDGRAEFGEKELDKMLKNVTCRVILNIKKENQ